ncbi:hypothetical protein D9M68_705310 [compost metagenome]
MISLPLASRYCTRSRATTTVTLLPSTYFFGPSDGAPAKGPKGLRASIPASGVPAPAGASAGAGSGGATGASAPGSYTCTGSPSKSLSANSSVARLKSRIVNQVLPRSSRSRVPRPMICLNRVIDLMPWSSTMSLQVCASTPVLMSLEVVAITGYGFSGSMKLSSSSLPSWLSPVI